MKTSNLIEDKFDRLDLLNRAIDSFNGAAMTVEKYYQNLEKRVRELDVELKFKNEALKRNLKEKESAKNHLNNILESLATGVIVIDHEERITSLNKATERLTGFSSKKVIGKKISNVFGTNFLKDFREHLSPINGIQGSVQLETELSGKGKRPRYVSVCISPVENFSGERSGIAITLQDISRMKRLEERANRAGRLAAMGEMAIKIAHEIRNPLGSIELFVSVLKKDLEGMKESRSLAEHISSGVKSINNIVSNLLLFIRPQEKPEFQIVDIHDVLDDSIFFSSHMLKSIDSIEVVTDYSSGPIMVYGDMELLKQVSLNIVLNAIQAMPEGGKLCITTERIEKRGETGLVEIKFADTGTGISKVDMAMVFDPFFSTKKKGTGLGLAIAHNIIKLHNGAIDIGSSEDEGVVCTVTLPLWDGKLNLK
jgi:two-component system sensor histidine kinase FlrB